MKQCQTANIFVIASAVINLRSKVWNNTRPMLPCFGHPTYHHLKHRMHMNAPNVKKPNQSEEMWNVLLWFISIVGCLKVGTPTVKTTPPSACYWCPPRGFVRTDFKQTKASWAYSDSALNAWLIWFHGQSYTLLTIRWLNLDHQLIFKPDVRHQKGSLWNRMWSNFPSSSFFPWFEVDLFEVPNSDVAKSSKSSQLWLRLKRAWIAASSPERCCLSCWTERELAKHSARLASKSPPQKSHLCALGVGFRQPQQDKSCALSFLSRNTIFYIWFKFLLSLFLDELFRFFSKSSFLFAFGLKESVDARKALHDVWGPWHSQGLRGQSVAHLNDTAILHLQTKKRNDMHMKRMMHHDMHMMHHKNICESHNVCDMVTSCGLNVAFVGHEVGGSLSK